MCAQIAAARAWNSHPGLFFSAEAEAIVAEASRTLSLPDADRPPRRGGDGRTRVLHVLTKAFYLVDSFPGRYATGQTWVEALPPAAEGAERRPARAGDGVSPIIITGNDLAAAWAVGRRGDTRGYAISSSNVLPR